MSSAKPLLYALLDSLMLLAPRGWTQVELSIDSTPSGPRVGALKTQGAGEQGPKPKPNLGVDMTAEALRFSEALSDLSQELQSRWTHGSITVERVAGAVDWRFKDAAGGMPYFARLDRHEVDSLLITDALFDALQGTERAFHRLQGQAVGRLSSVTGFAYDAGRATLRLDAPSGAVEVEAVVVGSYLPEVFTWVWSWADEETSGRASERVRRTCQPELRPEGLAAFWRPHFHADEGFAWALAGHVAVSLGARGLFRAHPPEAEGALFFAVMELPPLTSPA